MVEQVFLYQGAQRWNLGWQTPNVAGAFLVSLICILWAVRGPAVLKWFSFAIEVALYYALAKTYSRGALVGLLSAFAIFAATVREAQTWRGLGLRIIVLAVFIFETNLALRISPETISNDLSVLNRIALWKGGLKMVAAMPLSGWGVGESGAVFMGWFQEPGQGGVYRTMVNSYLHVATEYGLVVLFLILVLLFILVIPGAQPGRREGRPYFASIASVGGWAVSNCFSTLWQVVGLWVIPSICIVCILDAKRAITMVSHFRITAYSVVLSAAICGTVYASGTILFSDDDYAARRDSSGCIIYEPRFQSAATRWTIWPDVDVLGSHPGSELRRWVSNSKSPIEIDVHNADCDASPALSGNIMLFGKHCERLRSKAYFRTDVLALLVFHPSLPPPHWTDHFGGHGMVILPAVDEIGNSPAWETWARKCGFRVLHSPDCGIDIRPAWPSIVESAL